MFVVCLAVLLLWLLFIYALTLPYGYFMRLSFSPMVNIVFLIIYAGSITTILAFTGYKFIIANNNKYRDIGKLKLQSEKRKKASREHTWRIATPVQKLPTADSIQKLISEDGEIPDEALQNKHHN